MPKLVLRTPRHLVAALLLSACGALAGCDTPAGRHYVCDGVASTEECASTAADAATGCAPGSHVDATGFCAPDVDAPDASSVCGFGTEWVQGQCVATVECGGGTHVEYGSCVPDPAPPSYVDDGGTTVACGDGTHVDRGGCVPNDVAAALGSPEPCLVGGNVLSVYGDPDSFVYPGAHAVVGGQWANSMQYTPNPEGVLIEAHLPNSTSTDPWWFLFVDTPGHAPAKGIYPVDTAVTSGPSMQLQWGSSGCDAYGDEASGAFQILDITYHDAVVDSFTATFWQHCAGHTGITRGCVHVGP